MRRASTSFSPFSLMKSPGPSRVDYSGSATTSSRVAMVVNETAPLNTGMPFTSSYVINPTGRNRRDKRRTDRETTPSLSPKMTKEGNSGHWTSHSGAICQPTDPSTDNVTEDSEGCRTRRSSGLDALRSKVTLTLKNSGSVARDHLASERTFLAYMRTSLATVAAGIAFIQLFTSERGRVDTKALELERLHLAVRTLGTSAIVLGLTVIIIGVQRYFAIQAALTTGTFPAARLSPLVIAMALMLLATAIFSIALSGNLGI